MKLEHWNGFIYSFIHSFWDSVSKTEAIDMTAAADLTAAGVRNWKVREGTRANTTKVHHVFVQDVFLSSFSLCLQKGTVQLVSIAPPVALHQHSMSLRYTSSWNCCCQQLLAICVLLANSNNKWLLITANGQSMTWRESETTVEWMGVTRWNLWLHKLPHQQPPKTLPCGV